MSREEQLTLILNRLLARGVATEEERPLLEDYVAEVLERVENYIHQPVPDTLLYTCTSLTRQLYEAMASGDEEVATMTVGDTSITYRAVNQERRAVLDSLVGGVSTQLNRFRRGLFS